MFLNNLILGLHFYIGFGIGLDRWEGEKIEGDCYQKILNFLG
jgi:hypothetical protein